MTLRGCTELQEQSRNAAQSSAITHNVEIFRCNEQDHSWRWILPRDGSQLEMDDKTWISSGDGSRPDMDG
jgi:hypothetical protein